MHSVKSIAILAFASTALAAPRAQSWGGFGNNGWWTWGHSENNNNNNVAQPAAPSPVSASDYAVVTAFTTVFADTTPPTAAPTAAPSSEPAQPPHFSVAAPQPSSGPPAAPPAAPPVAPPAAPSSAPAASSNDGSYMSIVNEWRSKMGMGSLAEDGTLQGNALKTVQDSKGDMVHELNPGSFAQVLAPGQPSDFEHCFVGGWLCEKPSLPGLGSSVCDTASQGWSHDGETGHADILSSKSYSKIGCANFDGIWACDLA